MHLWFVLIPAAFVASFIAALTGTGGGMVLLPVLVAVFGVREAIPMYAFIQFIGNLGRIGFNSRLIDGRVVTWFCIGAVPAAMLGSWLFTRVPDMGLLRFLGVFLLLTVAWRWWRREARPGFPAPRFALIGAVFAGVSGVVGSAGPFLAPFYLSYGLVKSAFIGTEALGTAVMHVVKLSTYQSLGAMSPAIWLNGLLLGPLMIAGAYVGKRVLDRMPVAWFIRLVECIIIAFGVWFLIKT